MNDSRIRAQNALVKRAKNFEFFPVKYDADTGFAELVGSPVKPSSALSNEIDATFVRSDNHRRSLKIDRDAWRFELLVEFDREVLLTPFEDSVSEDPPVVLRDLDNGVPQVILELTEVEYDYPPQQQNTGLKARYVFTAFQTGIN